MQDTCQSWLGSLIPLQWCAWANTVGLASAQPVRRQPRRTHSCANALGGRHALRNRVLLKDENWRHSAKRYSTRYRGAAKGPMTRSLQVARRIDRMCRIEHTSQGSPRHARRGRRDSGPKVPGARCDHHVWTRDFATDHRERCTVLLSNVQGTNTLKRFHQCNSNGATPGRCDILLPPVCNFCVAPAANLNCQWKPASDVKISSRARPSKPDLFTGSRPVSQRDLALRQSHLCGPVLCIACANPRIRDFIAPN